MTTFTAAQLKALPPHIRAQLEAQGVQTDAAGRVRKPPKWCNHTGCLPGINYCCPVCLVAGPQGSGVVCDKCRQTKGE